MVNIPDWARENYVPPKLTDAEQQRRNRLLQLLNNKSKYWQQPRLTFVSPEQVTDIVKQAKASGMTHLATNELQATKLTYGRDNWVVAYESEVSFWDMSGRRPFLLDKQYLSTPKLLPCYLPTRLKQFKGTCYYNAGLHALISSRRLARVVLDAVMVAISHLPDADRHTVMDVPLFDGQDVCKKLMSWTDVLHLLFTLLSHEAPSHPGVFGMVPVSRTNVISNMVHATGFRPIDQNVSGGEPSEVIVHLLQKLNITYAYLTRRDNPHNLSDKPHVLVFNYPQSFFKRSLTLGAARYRLESCVLVYDAGHETSHAIVGLWCNNVPYVYNSNSWHAEQFDWTVPNLEGWKDVYHDTLVYVRI